MALEGLVKAMVWSMNPLSPPLRLMERSLT